MAENNDTRIVATKSGRNIIVDAADYPIVSGKTVYITPSRNGVDYYASVSINGKVALLHRLIMQPSADQVIDHINGNPLDNRRENLRACTRAENLRNAKTRKHSKSGIKGVEAVSLRSGGFRWRAEIKANKKRFKLGTFDTADQAHAAYCEAAIRLHGEFARFS